MQGFILSMQPIKNTDLIIRILTPTSIFDTYRFYGLRHSILSLGRKIDFEIQSNGMFLPKLRNVIQVGYPWENDYTKTYVWKIFIQKLHIHLRDIEQLEDFYFHLLENGAHKFNKQNPIRIALEMSAKLLSYEGRSIERHHDRCFVCEEKLGDHITVGKSFLLAHPQCVNGKIFQKNRIFGFLKNATTIAISDEEIEHLWDIFSYGL